MQELIAAAAIFLVLAYVAGTVTSLRATLRPFFETAKQFVRSRGRFWLMGWGWGLAAGLGALSTQVPGLKPFAVVAGLVGLCGVGIWYETLPAEKERRLRRSRSRPGSSRIQVDPGDPYLTDVQRRAKAAADIEAAKAANKKKPLRERGIVVPRLIYRPIGYLIMALFAGTFLYGCIKSISDTEKDDRPDHGCPRTVVDVIDGGGGYGDCVQDYYENRRNSYSNR